jgi:hypothetical protein
MSTVYTTESFINLTTEAPINTAASFDENLYLLITLVLVPIVGVVAYYLKQHIKKKKYTVNSTLESVK